MVALVRSETCARLTCCNCKVRFMAELSIARRQLAIQGAWSGADEVEDRADCN